jgi:purine-binding chemotaxis protein CheW
MESVSYKPHLSFRVQGARYALALDCVREVIDCGPVTPVPLMPLFVLGVINVRGCMIPVIDLAARFALAPTIPGKRTCLLITDAILDSEPHRIGLLVQAVESVVDVHTDDIQSAPSYGSAIRPDFIAGVVQDGLCTLSILDLRRVVALEDLQSTYAGEP